MDNTTPKFDDLVSDATAQPQSFDDLKDDSEVHDTFPGYVASAAEGALNTAFPVVGSKVLSSLGEDASPEAQRELKEQNPISYGVGQAAGLLFSPIGKAIGAAGEGLSSLIGGGVTGSAASLGLQSALVQTTDELAKYVLNDPNQSAQTAISDIGLSTLIGGALGGVGGLASKGLASLADTKAGEFVNDFRNRVLAHVAPESTPSYEVNPNYTKFGSPKDEPLLREGQPVPKPEIGKADTLGAKAADAFMSSKLAGRGLGFEAGQAMGRLTGIPGMGYIGGVAGAKYMGPALDAVVKPLLQNVVGIGGKGFNAAHSFIGSVAKGSNLLVNASKAIFEAGTSSALDFDDREKGVENLEKHLETINANPNDLLNLGGELGHYLPEQQKALAMAGQNAITHLQSQKPRDVQQGVMDRPIEPSQQALAAYKRTLGIAEQPLTVLSSLKGGTLQPKDVQDLNALYPNLVPKIIQQVHEAMIEHLAKGEVLPYKLRRGISMLSGNPLDSTLTQPAMLAAQMTYTPPQAPQMPQGKSSVKKGTSKLGKSAELAQTPEESRIKALSKQ